MQMSFVVTLKAISLQQWTLQNGVYFVPKTTLIYTIPSHERPYSNISKPVSNVEKHRVDSARTLDNPGFIAWNK